MAINIIAKLLATYLCITTATSWDLSHDAQIRSLSNQIDNMKSLLNQHSSPLYKYNYGHEVPWDSNSNRNTDYERYLSQQYILPILNSLNDISEQIVSMLKANAHEQNINVPFSMKFYPPNRNFGDINNKRTSFGSVSGWGIPAYAQSHTASSGNDYSSVSAGGFSSSGSSHGYTTGDTPDSFNYDSHRTELPNTSARFPDYEAGQNWGLVPETTDDNDNVRPLSLKPIPKTTQECNCDEQNRNVTSLALQLKLKTAEKSPVTCKSVILLCCVPGNTEEQRKECFTAQGCPKSYSTGIACLPVVIQAVYKDIYGNL